MGVSYSQLQLYRRCPKQYEFAVVRKVGRPISRGESFGGSIHGALKRWGELEMRLQAPEDAKKQLALFLDEPVPQPETLDLRTLQTMLRECFIAEGYPSRTEMDEALIAGKKTMELFFAWWKTEPRTVLANERGFKLQIDSEAITVSGRYDRVEKTTQGLRIIDFKTGEPRSQADCDEDLQLSIYALAAAEMWPEPVTELSLLFLNERGCTEIKTQRTAAQLEAAKSLIRGLCETMNAEDYTPTPTPTKCERCPYKDICPASMSR
jgi:RecB family exonuclease